LAELGYRVVRFTNADVLRSGEDVFDQLRGLLGEPEN
jgi:very-short-patch-repair endonuclease